MNRTDDIGSAFRVPDADFSAEPSSFYHEIYSRHLPMMYRLANSVLDSGDDADEAVQDALLKICRAAGKFRQEASMSTWIYRIVLNTALNKKRKNIQEKHTSSIDSPRSSRLNKKINSLASPPEYHPEHKLYRQEFRKLLQGEIKKLAPEMQKSAYLYYIRELSYRQISCQLRCSPGLVRTRIFRARLQLVSRMKNLLLAPANHAAPGNKKRGPVQLPQPRLSGKMLPHTTGEINRQKP